jgi:hypothetical protein
MPARVLEFTRVLAKIGHAFGIAELGENGFIPLRENLDLILERSVNGTYSVGRNLGCPVLQEIYEHSVGIQISVSSDSALDPMVCVLIRLYRGVKGVPTYHVAVGRLNMENADSRALFEKSRAEKGISPAWHH